MTLEELLPHLEGITTAKELGRRINNLGVPRGLKFKLACAARDVLGVTWTDKTVREWLKPVKHSEQQAQKERKASAASKMRNRPTVSAYWKARYANGPQFAATAKLRVRLNQAIRAFRMATGQNIKKRTKTLDLIGCTVEHLVGHIERQFEPGMAWEGIQIDHIRPLASFERPDDPAAWHWTNLQPLTPPDNAAKGSLWEGERHRYG